MSASSPPSNKARYDIYGPIHKGLRRSLCFMLERIGSTHFADEAQRTSLLNDVRLLFTLITKHLKHEEDHIHPPVEARIKGASSKLAHQHDEHRAEVEKFLGLMTQIETASDAARPALVREFYLRFGSFVVENLVHMGEEETEILPKVLHANFTDAEIQAMENGILSQIPPDLMLAYLSTMIPAMNRDERVDFLGQMKQGAPPEAFNAVMQGAARPNLTPADWQDLTQRLGVAA